MDIHKPKPWHGLREFLKEYLIIVVGVLTALGGEQLVEWAHWRHLAAEAREAIAFDFRGILGSAGMKDAESACTARRMEELSDVLDQAQATHRLPPLGYGGEAGNGGWTFRSWSGLTSGQTLAHLSNRDQLLLANVDRYLENLHEVTLEQFDDWAVLRTLSGPGRPTSDAEIAAFRVALAHARVHAVREKFGAHQVATLVAGSGFLTQREIDQAFDEGLAKAAQEAICRPPQPPSLHARDIFGGEPLTGAIRRPGSTKTLPQPGNAGALTTEK